MPRQYYRCPPTYHCRCVPGKPVSLKTARRHRNVALSLIHEREPSQSAYLPLPDPITEIEESVNSNETSAAKSTASSSGIEIKVSDELFDIDTSDPVVALEVGDFSCIEDVDERMMKPNSESPDRIH